MLKFSCRSGFAADTLTTRSRLVPASMRSLPYQPEKLLKGKDPPFSDLVSCRNLLRRIRAPSRLPGRRDVPEIKTNSGKCGTC